MRNEISEKAQQDLLNIEMHLLEKWNIHVLEDFFENLQHALRIFLEKKVFFKNMRILIFISIFLQNTIQLFIVMEMRCRISTEFFKTFKTLKKITNH